MRGDGTFVNSHTRGGQEREVWLMQAAVHRHSLDRLNTINDSSPPKKNCMGTCQVQRHLNLVQQLQTLLPVPHPALATTLWLSQYNAIK